MIPKEHPSVYSGIPNWEDLRHRAKGYKRSRSDFNWKQIS
jgi:hypothetical protein